MTHASGACAGSMSPVATLPSKVISHFMVSAFARLVLRRAVAGLAASALAARSDLVHAQVSNEQSSMLSTLTFKEMFRGQLAPPMPEPGASETICGAVFTLTRGSAIRGGAYASLLRLGVGDCTTPTAGTLSAAVDMALEHTAGRAAVYVGIQELSLDPGTASLLRQRGFKYHHFRQAPPDGQLFGAGGGGWRTGEHVYYRWNGDAAHDMVPAYSTSIEGVGGLVLSPDESKVLLIWEYGNWKPITGAVDEGESSLIACEREMLEEVGITMDTLFSPIFVGGWQMARARRSRQRQLQGLCDPSGQRGVHPRRGRGFEARWFALSDLEALYAAHDRPSPAAVRFIEQPELPEGRRKVSTDALAWLHTYAQGRGLPVSTIQRPGTNAGGLSLGLAWELLVVTRVRRSTARAAAAKWERWWWRRRKTAVRSKL